MALLSHSNFKRWKNYYLENSTQVIILIVLLVGSVGLGVSVIKLQNVFEAESQRNLDILQERKRGIENYAQRKLDELAKAAINDAINYIPNLLEDPMRDDSSYYWQQGEVIKIPIGGAKSAHDSHLLSAYQYLIDQNADDTANKSRSLLSAKQLLNQLLTAETNNNDPEFESVFRDVLTFTLSKDAAADQTGALATRIVQLEIYSRHKSASTLLVEKLLRTGLQDSQGNKLLGLQKLALQSLPHLGVVDKVWLTEKIGELSRQHHIKADDFLSRMANQPELPLIERSTTTDPSQEVISLTQNAWIVSADQNNVFGVRISKQTLNNLIELDMQKLGLLSVDDELTMQTPNSNAFDLNEVIFEWQSDAWLTALADSKRFYGLKNTIVIAEVVILVSIVVLIWWLYRVQARWVNSKSEFIATVSHELRTPLSSIRLMAERLADRLQGDNKAKDYPQRIVKDIDTLSFLTDNILSYERINSGKWISHLSPIGVSEIVNDLRNELPLFVNKAFETKATGPDDMQIYADPILIKLLFLNLAKNSCNYNNQEKAVLDISWHKSGTKTVLFFKDNGLGIAKNDLVDCFKPFARGASHKHIRGSGLGLALCRKIAHLHNGEIVIAHTDDNGTCFKIEFPSNAG